MSPERRIAFADARRVRVWHQFRSILSTTNLPAGVVYDLCDRLVGQLVASERLT